MEEVKMQYRDYKRHYANCETVRGSYDAGSKTIVALVPASMMQPQRGELSAPSVGKTIPGYGPTARDAAITEALQLAESGQYAE